MKPVARVAILGAALWLWWRGEANAGDLATVLTMFFMVQGYLRDVGYHISNLQRGVNEMEELVALHALPFGVTLQPSAQVQDAVIANAGATPWNRDPIDRRIVADVIEGRGEIIDSQDEVGGYPQYAETRRPFVESEWDLDTMEPHAGYARGEPLR